MPDMGTTVGLINSLTAGVKEDVAGKLEAPSTAGTSGQVLVSDGNGGQVWGDIDAGEVVIDSTLSVAGAAADAATCGALKTEISDIEKEIFRSDIKSALLACIANVAWATQSGQALYDDLYEALYNSTWEITYSLTGCIASNNINEITKGKPYSCNITPTAGYTMEGADVIVTMGGVNITTAVYSNGTINIASVTGQLSITAVAEATAVSSISAVYTQSGIVYSTDSLDDLKDDLVVTAVYVDTTTREVSPDEYTLSGTLDDGTCTITVSYGGCTDTFNVTVVGNDLIFNAYSDQNDRDASYGVAPFYIYHSTAYSYEYPTVVRSIEFYAASTGNLVIGTKDISDITGNINAGVITAHKTVAISATGKQKIMLAEPMTLATGKCIAIGNTSTAKFRYGTHSPVLGFTYGASSYNENSTSGIGFNIYGKAGE